MAMTRRNVIGLSGAAVAALPFALRENLFAQAPAQGAAPEPWPDTLVERPLRAGFPAPLPLNADGSAPEHLASEAGPISDPLMWRTPDRSAPPMEYDYQALKVKIDTRGLGTMSGTLR